MRRTANIALAALSAVPWVAAVLVLSNALHLRLLLGHWPVVHVDSSPTAMSRIHEIAAAWSVILSLVAAPLIGVVGALADWRTRPNRRLAALLAYAVGLALLWLGNHYDPLRYFEWLWD